MNFEEAGQTTTSSNIFASRLLTLQEKLAIREERYPSNISTIFHNMFMCLYTHTHTYIQKRLSKHAQSFKALMKWWNMMKID